MKRGTKILVEGEFKNSNLAKEIKKTADDLGLEGSVQIIKESKILIYAVGDADSIEEIIDFIYINAPDYDGAIESLDSSPMDVSKDFRGVFRIIN